MDGKINEKKKQKAMEINKQKKNVLFLLKKFKIYENVGKYLT
jgi:hypothetical protein